MVGLYDPLVNPFHPVLKRPPLPPSPLLFVLVIPLPLASSTKNGTSAGA
jgi:hypothetical protein